MASISEVKSSITGKSRANRFRVTIPTPFGVITDVLAKSSSLPGRSFEVMSIKHRGAEIKLPGEPKYNDWKVEMYAEGYEDYEKMYNWMNAIGENIENTRGNVTSTKISSVKVDQIGLDNEVIATMYLDGVFPLSIEDITFDNDSAEMVRFAVNFSIDATRFEKA